MDHVTILIFLAGLSLAFVLPPVVAILRGRKKFSWLALSDGASNVLFLGALVLLSPVSDWLEARGVPGLLAHIAGFAAVMVAMVPWLLVLRHRMKTMQKLAVANPQAGDAERVGPCEEEKQVGRRINLLVLALGLAAVMPLLWLAFQPDTPGLSTLPPLFLYMTAFLALGAYVAVGKWPGGLSRRAEVEIDAPPETVWAALRYREHAPHWNPAIKRIARRAGPEEAYSLHYFNTRTCNACGLPHDPDSPDMVIDLVITDDRAPERMVVACDIKRSSTGAGDFLKSETETFTLERLPDGRTRLTSRAEAHWPRAWFAIVLMLGNAPRQMLLGIKGHVEGRHLGSLYDQTALRLDAARKAERFCGCGSGA